MADFVDADIAEKLEALEREEEKLEAEGFYDEEDDPVESDEEEFQAELRQSLFAKKASQDKNKLKNRPVLPRTAGLRTLSTMSQSLRKAGYDPARIEARAEVLAKAQGYSPGKRKRDDQDEMDVDEGSDDNEQDAMEMDDTSPPPKRLKSKRGPAGALDRRRAASKNRQLAGMRDDTVCR